jgi:hypothetical protein
VFGVLAYRVSETIEMPTPGDLAPARHHLAMRDRVWVGLYEPLAEGVLRISQRLNRLQFLTIRQYLGVVLGLLVTLLLVLASWP